MNTTDQTFFAAYGQSIPRVNEPSHAAPTRKSPSAKVNPQRLTPSAETQHSDGAWYRLDSQHVSGQSAQKPHLESPRTPNKKGTESVSVEIGSWTSTDVWQSSCVVMAANLPEEPSKPVPSREPTIPFQNATPPLRQPAIESKAAELPPSEPEPQTPTTPSATGWVAQWEVDRFAWPDELERLQSEQSEYFRYAGEKLRDACQEGLKSMAIVATREQEGCTTMAICLARAAAAAGARVALLDANLRRPELGPKLGLDFSHGWQESLNESSPLEEAAVLALDSNLTLLPLSTAHSLRNLSDSRISDLLREVAEAFDLLIIDAGVVPGGDSGLLESGSDCPVNAALVVRDLRRTSEAETLHTAAQLKRLGIDAVGIAENFSPRPENQVAAA